MVTFLLTRKPEAALSFYRDTRGLAFVRDDGFALVVDMHGVTLRISKVAQFTSAEYTVLAWETDQIAPKVDRGAAKGIPFRRYPGMQQDDRGICTFPGRDQVAWFKDPDGNVLSLSQHAAA